MLAIPVTALYLGLNALLALVLAGIVSRKRVQSKVTLGHGEDEKLLQAIRVQGNFVEYVPIALLLILVLEIEGAPLWLLHGLGILLTVGRITHAQALLTSPSVTAGRGLGTLFTWIVYIVGAGACLYYGWT